MVNPVQIFSSALEFALPPRCPLCGVIVREDRKFCLPCWHKLDFIGEPWCSSCGMPFAFERPEGAVCAQCLEKKPEHDGVRTVVAYDNNSSKIAMGLKYSSKLGFADLIAEHLGKYASSASAESILVPVPLHRWRIWNRGFNQSELIARALSREYGIAQNSNLIRRIRATPPLRSKSAKHRAKIVNKAFEVSQQAPEIVSGKTIILIDDVYTTGATANACAKLLKKAGASAVFVFCWARVLSGEIDSQARV